MTDLGPFSKPVSDPTVETLLDARYLRSDGSNATLAMLPPGAVFEVVKVGSSWLLGGVGSALSSRPAVAAGVRMISLSSDGTFPSFAITNDITLT